MIVVFSWIVKKTHVKFSEPTPNSSAYKWILNQSFAGDRMYEFSSLTEVEDFDLAKALWDLNTENIRVSKIFFHDNIIVLTKVSNIDWSKDFIEEVTQCIETYFSTKKLDKIDTKEVSEEEKMIIEVIRDYIQPAVAKHGGYINFKYFQNNIVYLSMHGACDGCASASFTLQNGIENILKFYVPGVNSVKLADEAVL